MDVTAPEIMVEFSCGEYLVAMLSESGNVYGAGVAGYVRMCKKNL